MDSSSKTKTHKFPYKWYLKDGYPAKGIEYHGKKVFSTFACGGGSTMGYKLAGYDVIGANDIDPKMMKVYKENHDPRMYYLNDIRDFNKLIKEGKVNKELYELDILDGSPPCSTFSMAGSREKVWGKKKRFREGQSEQVLDDLFFYFIETVGLLKPKVVIAENVKGLIQGNAKGYLTEIVKQLKGLGYKVQVFLLNAASMGVPQKRERVFVIGYKVSAKKLNLRFNEEQVLYKEFDEGTVSSFKMPSKCFIPYWKKTKPGSSLSKVHPKGHYFNSIKLSKNRVMNTIVSHSTLMHYKQCRLLTKRELTIAGTFPLDYDFLDIKSQYLIGMSVPPVMMAQIANEVYNQLLN